MKRILSTFITLFAFLAFPLSTFATDGTFTASNYSFDPVTNVLTFDASNFNPPRTEDTGLINDYGISLYNSQDNFVLDYFSYHTGDCYEGDVYNLQDVFSHRVCYNNFWHADLPTDNSPLNIRVSQSASGSYRSQAIPANQLLTTIPSPTPTPSVPVPNEGTFTASNYSFNPITHVLQFTATNFNPPRQSNIGAINDFGISLYNSLGIMVLDYFTYNNGSCFEGNLPNLTTVFNHVVCYNDFWHADLPTNNYPVVFRIAQSASGNYHSQPIPATELVASPTPTPTPMPQLNALSPAKVLVGLKNSDDVGVKFDLKAEVYKDNSLVSSGEVDSVVAGSSGFNNAKLNTIAFNSFSPIDFPSGSQLSLKLYVRNACSGSGHNSGVARLWFNDAQANSQFGATIDAASNNYYLLPSSVLSTSVGSGPKSTIDVQSGAKCSAFKLFSTWSVTP